MTKAIISIDKEKNIEDYKCCKNPNNRLLSTEFTQEELDLVIPKLRECYHAIKEIITRYMDMNEESKIIVSLWIIGTYLHDEFESFPFLFINAMKGSGKTRLLKLINVLCYKGKLTNNTTPAVLFRTAEENI